MSCEICCRSRAFHVSFMIPKETSYKTSIPLLENSDLKLRIHWTVPTKRTDWSTNTTSRQPSTSGKR